LDIIGLCAFGTDLKAQQDSTSNYVQAIKTASELVFKRLFNPLYHTRLYPLFPSGRKFSSVTKIIHKLSDSVIAERRAAKNQPASENQSKYRDFLDILLEATDESGEQLSNQEIRAEVDTFMFEGHDTTASGLTWTLYSLAAHPDVQAEVQKEIDEIFPENLDDIDFEEWYPRLNKMIFTPLAIKEALRLYPPVPYITRRTSSPSTIMGYSIPADTEIFILTYAIHRNPTYWGEDVNEFKPRRFEKDLPNPLQYAPFSAGKRNCVGQQFAMLEEKSVLVVLLKRFSFRVAPNQKIVTEPHLILRPANGIKLIIHPRS